VGRGRVFRTGRGPGTVCSPYHFAVVVASATCGNVVQCTGGRCGKPAPPVLGQSSCTNLEQSGLAPLPCQPGSASTTCSTFPRGFSAAACEAPSSRVASPDRRCPVGRKNDRTCSPGSR